MKIYNAKTATVQLPLGMRRIVISGRSLSQDFMPTNQFLQMIARTFSPKELALIVSGAWEGNMCAEVPTLHEYCVSSIEEALARFNPTEEPKKEEPKPEPVPEINEEPEVESNPETPVSDVKNEEKEQEKETKKAKRVRTAKKVTKKKKAEEEKPAEE